MSSRFQPGTNLHPFRVRNARGETVALPAADAEFTHLQFRRFAGCPICSLHLRDYARRTPQLRAAGIRPAVFFHSTPEELRAHHDHLPFDVIPDPAKQHYRRFGVATSLRSVLHPRAIFAALRGVFLQTPGLRMRGGATGLPAEFLVARDGTVHATHYGAHADDHWTVDDLLVHALQASTRRRTSPSFSHSS